MRSFIIQPFSFFIFDRIANDVINTEFVKSLLDFHNIEFEIDYRKLICFRQVCCLPADYTAKDILLYRLLNLNNQISFQRGFIPDIYRILGKYSLLPILITFVENGTFVSKTSWKNLVNENIRELCAAERARKVQVCPLLKLIINIYGMDRDFIMWKFCKQCQHYLSLTYKAVCMLGRMFSVKWYHNCYLCGDLILSESTHLQT